MGHELQPGSAAPRFALTRILAHKRGRACMAPSARTRRRAGVEWLSRGRGRSSLVDQEGARAKRATRASLPFSGARESSRHGGDSHQPSLIDPEFHRAALFRGRRSVTCSRPLPGGAAPRRRSTKPRAAPGQVALCSMVYGWRLGTALRITALHRWGPTMRVSGGPDEAAFRRTPIGKT